jgi:hypothetical protein
MRQRVFRDLLCREQAVGAFDELGSEAVWLCVSATSMPQTQMQPFDNSTNCQTADHRLNECHCGGPKSDCPQ